MLSLQLLNGIDDERTSTHPKIEPETPTVTATISKWSASNAFDPDSEEFWNGDDVVYEAFVDVTGDSSDDSPVSEETERENEQERERLLEEETNSLVASGNESRRRRRETQNAWIAYADMDRVVSPAPAAGPPWTYPDGTPFPVASGRMAGNRPIQEQVRALEESLAARRAHAAPTVTTTTTQTASSAQSQGQNLGVEMMSDVAHRTTSPLPYFSYGDVSVFIPATHHSTPTPSTSRHRRRESQPAPTTSTLLFT